jgi:hypothetical protein
MSAWVGIISDMRIPTLSFSTYPSEFMGREGLMNGKD